MRCWFAAQGVTRANRKAMPQDQWLALLGRYWQAVREGWWPDVPRSDWVGPHHPFKNDDPARGRPVQTTRPRQSPRLPAPPSRYRIA
jgi:hypothetical protein